MDDHVQEYFVAFKLLPQLCDQLILVFHLSAFEHFDRILIDDDFIVSLGDIKAIL